MKLLKIAVASCGIWAMMGANSLVYGQQAADALRFSQYNYGFSTARSSAMGGAFGSLGADLSSMSLNPAGLGMYRSSEVSISPRLTISSTTENSGVYTNTENKTRFGITNVGAVVTLKQAPSSALKSFTLGFGYNRLADYSRVSYSRGADDETSIGDLFAEQLSFSGNIKAGTLQTPENGDSYQPFRNYESYYWGGILGYQTFFINPLKDNDAAYSIRGALNKGDRVAPSQRMVSKGGIDEYNISAGFNIQDFLYFGVSVGIQDLNYTNYSSYEERALVHYNVGDLERLQYRQNLKISGSGANFKFGVTVRPVGGLRIGAAIHTPTYSSMDEEYSADMEVHYRDMMEYGAADTPYLLNEYDLETPARFIAGISYTFNNIGVISADYERTWYNKMKGSGYNIDYFNDDIRASYLPTDNFRVGAEAIITPQVVVRAGYAYYASPFNYGLDKKIGATQNISGGLGFRSGAFFADLAYVYMQYKGAPYRYFNETFSDNYDSFNVASSTIVTPSEKRHNLILTVGAKF